MQVQVDDQSTEPVAPALESCSEGPLETGGHTSNLGFQLTQLPRWEGR